MKYRLAALISLLAILIMPVLAIDVVYTDGIVDIKYADGDMLEALIGDVVRTGDTVITGETGIAELQPATGSLIKISPDTVFQIGEIELNHEKRTVLTTAIGAVRLSFDRWTGKEPLVATPIAVAGVRGTELEVFAGSDGSVLIVVASGAVDVTARGRSVSLAPNEGVEVQPGSPPGEKFEVLRGQMDFSAWNGERESRILENPLAALQSAARGLDSLIDEIQSIIPQYEERKRELAKLREALEAESDRDKQKSMYEQRVFPLEIETSYLALNLRYYSLSALSYRRFVLGTIYMRTKLLEITGTPDVDMPKFEKLYQEVLNHYERTITPYLVNQDI